MALAGFVSILAPRDARRPRRRLRCPVYSVSMMRRTHKSPTKLGFALAQWAFSPEGHGMVLISKPRTTTERYRRSLGGAGWRGIDIAQALT